MAAAKKEAYSHEKPSCTREFTGASKSSPSLFIETMNPNDQATPTSAEPRPAAEMLSTVAGIPAVLLPLAGAPIPVPVDAVRPGPLPRATAGGGLRMLSRMSASTLAKGPHDEVWGKWWDNVKGGFDDSCYYEARDNDPLKPLLIKLEERKGAIEFPVFLANRDELQTHESVISRSDYGRKFINEMGLLIRTRDNICKDDKYHLKGNLGTLFAAWADTSRTEAHQRRGPDLLLNLVFFLERGLDVRYESDIAMPVGTNPNPVLTCATADTTISLPFPLSTGVRFRNLMRCRWDNDQQVHFGSFLVFPAEFKRTKSEGADAIRQLTMDMVGALYHYDQIGLGNVPIYGATIVSLELTIFVAAWLGTGEERNINIAKSVSWDLTKAGEFIECYLFLCSLADDIKAEFANAADIARKIKQAEQKVTDTDKSWRMHNPRSGSRAGSQDSGGTGRASKRGREEDDLEDSTPTEGSLVELDSEQPLVYSADEWNAALKERLVRELPSSKCSLPFDYSYDRIFHWRENVA